MKRIQAHDHLICPRTGDPQQVCRRGGATVSRTAVPAATTSRPRWPEDMSDVGDMYRRLDALYCLLDGPRLKQHSRYVSEGVGSLMDAARGGC
jgi:hypothetical protein